MMQKILVLKKMMELLCGNSWIQGSLNLGYC